MLVFFYAQITLANTQVFTTVDVDAIRRDEWIDRMWRYLAVADPSIQDQNNGTSEIRVKRWKTPL